VPIGDDLFFLGPYFALPPAIFGYEGDKLIAVLVRLLFRFVGKPEVTIAVISS
jgi:hypothetical protein